MGVGSLCFSKGGDVEKGHPNLTLGTETIGIMCDLTQNRNLIPQTAQRWLNFRVSNLRELFVSREESISLD